jgi:hypothetical protein
LTADNLFFGKLEAGNWSTIPEFLAKRIEAGVWVDHFSAYPGAKIV